MLSTRLISMCILIPIIVTNVIILTIKQLLIFIFFICLISAWEWGKIMRFSAYMHQFWMCTIFGLLYVIAEILIFQNYSHFDFWCVFKYMCTTIVLWWISVYLLILFYPSSAVFWKNSNILRFCFGILIIIPFFWGVLTLRKFYCVTTNEINGMWWLLYITILIWINDSGAYMFGRTLGHYKLLKKVSPQKTWEGFIGGALISTGAACLFSIYSPILIFIKPLVVFICSVSAIFSATIGDFAESMFKREAGIKDSGYFIPGHGGILDRIDSLIAAIPVFTCLMLLIYADDIIKIEII